MRWANASQQQSNNTTYWRDAAHSTLRRLRHGTVTALVFMAVAGVHHLYLVLVGLAAWTLLEYLVHRFAFHWHAGGRLLHQHHHDQPGNLDAERSSLSTPLLALPIGSLLIVAAGVEAGSALFAGLLLGYLAFITLHHVVHRWQIGPDSRLYSAKIRHLIHHNLEHCNFGVTTDFWDFIFRTRSSVAAKHQNGYP